MQQIELRKDILSANEDMGHENKKLFARKGIFVLNLMSSPGAGKTTLLERTIELLKDTFRIGVIEGDIATAYDAERIDAHGVAVTQINTGGACHLDSSMIRKVLVDFDLDHLDMLIIENVGNLVCPANYDLGEAMKAVVLSTAEGDDKPLKYPGMLRNASVVILNKIDLLPYLNCNLAELKSNALQINSRLEVFETSCTTSAGIPRWCDWLMTKGARKP